MKTIKSFIVAVILLCGATNVNAQSTNYYNTRHEIGLTIGSGANTEIFSGLADMTQIVASSLVSTTITGGAVTTYYTYGDEKYLPTISAEYYYHVNKVIGIGGFVSINGLDRDMYVNVKNNSTETTTKERTGKASRRNISIIPTVKFDWLRKKNIGLYSKVGVGASIMRETQKDDVKGGTDFKETDAVVNFHISLLGFEAGSENFRGFVELGCGEQGILLAGVKYKF